MGSQLVRRILVGLRGKLFHPLSLLPNQTLEKSHFPLPIFHPPLFNPTKWTIKGLMFLC